MGWPSTLCIILDDFPKVGTNPNEGSNYMVICIDKLEFNQDNTINQVKMTFKVVQLLLIKLMQLLLK
jgi:hypothetical protein